MAKKQYFENLLGAMQESILPLREESQLLTAAFNSAHSLAVNVSSISMT